METAKISRKHKSVHAHPVRTRFLWFSQTFPPGGYGSFLRISFCRRVIPVQIYLPRLERTPDGSIIHPHELPPVHHGRRSAHVAPAGAATRLSAGIPLPGATYVYQLCRASLESVRYNVRRSQGPLILGIRLKKKVSHTPSPYYKMYEILQGAHCKTADHIDSCWRSIFVRCFGLLGCGLTRCLFNCHTRL